MLIDAHCHIATDCDPCNLNTIAGEYEKFRGSLRLTLMSTNHIDFQYVTELANRLGDMIIPCYGVHPWYSHLFTFETGIDKLAHYKQVFELKEDDEIDEDFLTVLPDPMNFDKHLKVMKRLYETHSVVCVGEIGLDKLFRIPSSGFYSNPDFRSGKEDIRLTNYKTSMKHQKRVFSQQLQLAFELNLSVSIHNVKSGGLIHEVISKEIPDDYSAGVCLHSFTGSLDTLKLFIKTFSKRSSTLFVSLSHFINNRQDKRDELTEILKQISPSNILIESDMAIDQQNPLDHLKAIEKSVLEIKGWESGEIFVTNYQQFLNK